MKTSSVKRNLEPEQPKSPPMPLESIEDIAWELWLLIELLAPVRRRLPNTASQKLVDYAKATLFAISRSLTQSGRKLSAFHTKRFRFVRLGPQAIGSGKGSLEFGAV
jgi:hypothetical protein